MRQNRKGKSKVKKVQNNTCLYVEGGLAQERSNSWKFVLDIHRKDKFKLVSISRSKNVTFEVAN